MSEHNFYQIDHTGVKEPELATQGVEYTTLSGVITSFTAVPIRRAVDSKIANFGIKNVGLRSSVDYTTTVNGFQSKDNLLDHNVLVEDTGMGSNVAGRGINVDHNPYMNKEWDSSANAGAGGWVISTHGSTIKRVRDEQAFRMSMSDNRGVSIDAPGFDVMDTDVVNSGMTAGKNWPTEGHRSFGGKYDFMPYTGGGIH